MIPKNAPISIIPSRPMFTTPERSENMPPSEANASGVANRSIAARSADQTTTLSSLPTLDSVAANAIAKPNRPDAIANPPNRRSPRIATPMPSITAISASTRLGTHDRSVSGGRAIQAATMPMAMPIQATRRSPWGIRAATGSATLVMPTPLSADAGGTTGR